MSVEPRSDVNTFTTTTTDDDGGNGDGGNGGVPQPPEIDQELLLIGVGSFFTGMILNG